MILKTAIYLDNPTNQNLNVALNKILAEIKYYHLQIPIIGKTKIKPTQKDILLLLAKIIINDKGMQNLLKDLYISLSIYSRSLK